VVATNGGGVPEIVIDELTGILVPMKDSRALARAMARLLGDASLRAQMGAAARDHVERNFTIRKTAKAVERVAHMVLTLY
jgi:glycosyltransferase involved in cell wall biosynthesis